MKLPGWQALGGSSSRYINPQGSEVSRREYLNAQARSVGWASYSQYQGQGRKPLYSQIIAASSNPKEARKLDSAFNSAWAKNIEPKIEKGGKIGSDLWGDIFDAADVDPGEDVVTRYKGKK